MFPAKERAAMQNRIKLKDAKTARWNATVGGSCLLALAVLLLGLVGPATVQAQDEATEAASSFDYSAQTLRVGVWLEGQDDGAVLQRGDYYTVGFQTNQDAYAVVYRIDANGMVDILWPRTRYDDGFAFGGHEYQLPVAGAKRLQAGYEPGEGFIEAIVSSYPFDLRELELDFHHENATKRYDFQVAGDPFLAMNEINFVVTGLEDSEEFVVTNYASFYVHQKVDHPRYLCNQCHFDDEVAYDPYQDECTLDIQYDYGWNNNWYDQYGYYPIYANPVYVYVDPWTTRPWVNFWYDPWYRCAPGYGWGWRWNYSCYSWYDSPYYWGNSYTYYNNGHRRWRPLDRSALARADKVKTREFGRVTGLIGKERPDDRQREAMRARTSLADNRRVVDRDLGRRGAPGVIRGEARADRARPEITGTSNVRGSAGLRIKDNTRVRTGEGTQRTNIRHTSGGGETRSALKPARRLPTEQAPDRSSSSVRTTPRTGTQRDNTTRGTQVKPDRSTEGGRTIKPVEPRRRGSRVWNTRPETKQPERNLRSPSNRTQGSDKPRVQPRNNSRNSKPVVKPRSNNSGSSNKQPTAPPRVKSAPKSKSSGATSGGNTRSGGSKSSGSKSGGSKSSGSSRGGSTTRR
jgi:uncharacterized membrane protein YgcG